MVRRRFSRSALVSFLTASLSVLALQSSAETLEETVRKVVASNPALNAAAANRRASDQEVNQARAGYLPSIDLAVGGGYERSNNATTRSRFDSGATEDANGSLFRQESSLTLSQMLFDGFATPARVAQQRALQDAAASAVGETSESIGLRAVEVFLDVQRHRELVALSEENLRQHEEYYRQIDARSRAGRGSMADVQQAEGRLALARANLFQAQGRLQDTVARYVTVVNESPGTLDPTTADRGWLPESLEALQALAKDINPSLARARANVEAARAALRESKASFAPRIDFEASTSRNDNIDGTRGGNHDTLAMVRLRYNLYRGGGDLARNREQVQRLRATQEDLDQSQRIVLENVRVAWNAYQTANRRLEPLQTHVRASERSRTAYKSQFDLGQRTLLDVLDAESELFNAQSSYVSARFTSEFAVYQVLANTGVLLSRLDISSPQERAKPNHSPAPVEPNTVRKIQVKAKIYDVEPTAGTMAPASVTATVSPPASPTEEAPALPPLSAAPVDGALSAADVGASPPVSASTPANVTPIVSPTTTAPTIPAAAPSSKKAKPLKNGTKNPIFNPVED
jgi:adhesin transport system outer membrane protein